MFRTSIALTACMGTILTTCARAQQPTTDTLDPDSITPEILTNKQIVRIEKHWVAYVVNLGTQAASPQIVNVISPDSSLDGAFGMFQSITAQAPSSLPAACKRRHGTAAT